MKAIETYSMFYRPKDDSGSIHLVMEGGSTADIFTNSAGESAFLLDLLRHEEKCYYDIATEQISTGIDFVGAGGEGE